MQALHGALQSRESHPQNFDLRPAQYAHIYGHMKTTIEIDEEKLGRIMKLTGIETMKEAVDWALSEALRIATINRVMEKPLSADEIKAAVDPSYDIIAIRNGTLPRRAVAYRGAGRPRSKKS